MHNSVYDIGFGGYQGSPNRSGLSDQTRQELQPSRALKELTVAAGELCNPHECPGARG